MSDSVINNPEESPQANPEAVDISLPAERPSSAEDAAPTASSPTLSPDAGDQDITPLPDEENVPSPRPQAEPGASPSVPTASPAPELQATLGASASGPAASLTPPAPAPPQPRANPLTRRELLAWVTATALVTMFISVLLTLVVLSAINGTLLYVTPAQYNNLSRQVDALNGQVKTLSTDLESLRSRVDTLSSLSGRLDTVEKDAQAIHTQLDDSAKLVKEIQDQISGISQSILNLQKSSQTFQNFINGLRDLLNGTAQP